ncbi:Callose synthase 7 [Arabidopsis thaliana]
MGLVIFTPIAVLSWFPFVSEFQTRLLFNQAFSRGLQISMILAGKKDKETPSTKYLGHTEESFGLEHDTNTFNHYYLWS